MNETTTIKRPVGKVLFSATSLRLVSRVVSAVVILKQLSDKVIRSTEKRMILLKSGESSLFLS
jgi:hypothetical protein